ncbi:hypothetical protein TNCV_1611751 [Trichonephila clavipes]|nr:hypothetical protein TNCV_1611751 [Trichonephila clavipes]
MDSKPGNMTTVKSMITPVRRLLQAFEDTIYSAPPPVSRMIGERTRYFDITSVCVAAVNWRCCVKVGITVFVVNFYFCLPIQHLRSLGFDESDTEAEYDSDSDTDLSACEKN